MQPDDALAEKWQDARAHARIWTPAPTVMLTRIEGHVGLEALRFYTLRADELIHKHGRLYVFHHWSGITAWEPLVRDQLRKWAAGHDGHLPGTHFLIRSRMLSMAIEVAALALGRELHAHRSEATFFAELDRVVAQESASASS
ncbi:MAG: hypothetical protein HOV80_18645 [Polyangiaceae bacterium]|nr:hypothetical protein [Polyangiaceae bacterium]